MVSPIATSAVGVALPPNDADTKLMLGQLALRGGVFWAWCTCILACGGGGCCYGVLVLGKCAGVSQRKY